MEEKEEQTILIKTLHIPMRACICVRLCVCVKKQFPLKNPLLLLMRVRRECMTAAAADVEASRTGGREKAVNGDAIRESLSPVSFTRFLHTNAHMNSLTLTLLHTCLSSRATAHLSRRHLMPTRGIEAQFLLSSVSSVAETLPSTFTYTQTDTHTETGTHAQHEHSFPRTSPPDGQVIGSHTLSVCLSVVSEATGRWA